MAQLPLTRDSHGILHFAGTVGVSIHVDGEVLGSGAHGTVRPGWIRNYQGVNMLQVAIKTLHQDHEHSALLFNEAQMHSQALARLPHVLPLLGFLPAYGPTDSPAMLITTIAWPLESYLVQARCLNRQYFNWPIAIARLSFQLREFIVSADENRFMHGDLKMKNIYVKIVEDIGQAELAVGHFGGSQHGASTEDGDVTYRLGDYTWGNTSPQLVSFVYRSMAAAPGTPCAHIEIDRKLAFHNELFAWARMAFKILTNNQPPDTLFGPSHADHAEVPALGQDDVSDAVHNMLTLALRALTVVSIDQDSDSTCITAQPWYDTLSDVMAVNEPA